MKPAYTKISIVLVLIAGLITAVAIYFYYDNKKFKIEADCGMENGPIYGRIISLDIKNIDVEQAFEVEGRKIFISNTTKTEVIEDTLAPILFKIDSNYQVLWAVELKSDNEIDFFAMEDIKLLGHEIHFFNSTHLEPGIIYLDENYDFKYMCLSMF